MNRESFETKLAQEAVRRSDELERDFIVKGGGLGAWLLAASRTEAADALRRLVDVDPADHETIRKLQNDVQRSRDLLEWMHAVVESGRDAWQKLTTSDQEDLVRVLGLEDEMD
jgi:hypothetical protein